MSIMVANCVQKVTVFFVVEITNLLEERKAGHLTVVTVDGGVQFELKVCSVYLPTSLRGVLKCKKGSLSVVYSGQERTYEFKCKLAMVLWTLRTQSMQCSL